MTVPTSTFATFPAGNFPASLWDVNWAQAYALSNIYCTAAGSNSISLTPATTSPRPLAYQNGMKFTFLAAANNTGAVFISFSSLASLPVYDQTGLVVSASSAITSNTYYEAVYDSSLNSGNGGFRLVGGFGSSGGGVSYREVTAAGSVIIGSSDNRILLNKTVGAATSIILPVSSSRASDITVKDYKGDANTNNITFVPNGAETIDGFSGAAAAANGIALIDINYAWKTLAPLTSGGWYVIGGL